MPDPDRPSTSLAEEAIEHHAHLTRLLLDHVHALVTGGISLRGVLPTPDAVRIVTGASEAVAAGRLTAYEIPLLNGDEPVTAPLVLGWTRAFAADGTARTDATVMGMTLVR